MTVFACGLIKWEEAQQRDKDDMLALWLTSAGVNRVVGRMRQTGETSKQLDVPLSVRRAFNWPTSRVVLKVSGNDAPCVSPICEIPA